MAKSKPRKSKKEAPPVEEEVLDEEAESAAEAAAEAEAAEEEEADEAAGEEAAPEEEKEDRAAARSSRRAAQAKAPKVKDTRPRQRWESWMLVLAALFMAAATALFALSTWREYDVTFELFPPKHAPEYQQPLSPVVTAARVVEVPGLTKNDTVRYLQIALDAGAQQGLHVGESWELSLGGAPHEVLIVEVYDDHSVGRVLGADDQTLDLDPKNPLRVSIRAAADGATAP